MQKGTMKPKHEHMIQWGLYEERRQYAPDNLSPMDAWDQGYTQSEMMDGRQRWYRIDKIPYEVSDVEYARLQALFEQGNYGFASRNPSQQPGNDLDAPYNWMDWLKALNPTEWMLVILMGVVVVVSIVAMFFMR